MNITAQLFSVMRCIASYSGPVGASTLCRNASLKMSQATIGRILITLEELGYIEKVSNKGRILTENGSNFLRENDNNANKVFLANELINLSSRCSEELIAQIIVIRQLLEPYSCENAALFATDQEIQDIENLAYAYRYRISRNKPAYQEDLTLHLVIAKASKNDMLRRILELLLTENNAYVEFSRAGDANRDVQVNHHFAIMEAIKQRNPTAARNAMEEHLKIVYESVVGNQTVVESHGSAKNFV